MEAYCYDCDQTVEAVAVPQMHSRRRYLHLCPKCGGQVRIHTRKRETVPVDVAGVLPSKQLLQKSGGLPLPHR